MKFIVILFVIVLVIICYNYQLSSVEQFDNTTVAPQNVDWTTLSQARCTDLKTDMKQITEMLSSCDLSSSVKNDNEFINNRINCYDAVNRQLFNNRESQSWCASADGTKTIPLFSYAAIPSKIDMPSNMIQDVFTNQNEKKMNTTNNVHNDTIYKYINAPEFHGITYDTLYASI